MRLPLRIPLALAALLLVVLALAAAGAFAENIDPLNDNSQYAWGENVGWLNAEPSGEGGPGIAVTSTKLTGYMWGENMGWINMNCQNNYGPGCPGSPGGNWGVTNDGAGNLGGYAWGENAGWISFSCSNNPGTCAGTGNYGVKINQTTGVFSGSAWGENIGWITFSSSGPVAYKVQTGNCPSGASTAWVVPLGDDDCDGFDATVEARAQTDPLDPCPDNTADNAWPPDNTNSGKVDIIDVGAYRTPFNKSDGQPGYNRRLELAAPLTTINIVDIGAIRPFFNKSCTP